MQWTAMHFTLALALALARSSPAHAGAAAASDEKGQNINMPLMKHTGITPVFRQYNVAQHSTTFYDRLQQITNYYNIVKRGTT